MDWSRAKTILILFLFAVNAFLFGTYMMKENEAKKDGLQLQSEVIEVLRNQGISVSEETIPSEQVEIRHATVKVSEDTASLAKALLGEVEETVEQGRTVYSGALGNMMFSSESFSVVYEDGSAVNTSEEAKSLAKSIAGKLDLSTSGNKISVESAQGGYDVTIPQVFGGVRVFGADVELKISSSGSVLGKGSFIGAGQLIRAEGKTMKVSALLLEFADEIKKAGIEKITVKEIQYGYLPKKPAGGSVYLLPTLEISTDSGVFYVDMSDGELLHNS